MSVKKDSVDLTVTLTLQEREELTDLLRYELYRTKDRERFNWLAELFAKVGKGLGKTL